MYRCCAFCDRDLDEGEHDENCDMLKARRALGQEWDDYVRSQKV